MPKKLELEEYIVLPCQTCHGDDEDCGDCGGDGEYDQKVSISSRTVRVIYAAIVKQFGEEVPSTCTCDQPCQACVDNVKKNGVGE